jgi:signal transduction histidine kinase
LPVDTLQSLSSSHSFAGEKRVELEYMDQGLQMRVRDNGIAIDPQVLHEGRAGHFGF